MISKDILEAPASALPKMLVEAGFAPLGARIDVNAMDYLRALHYSPELWQPHARWDHAMPMLTILQRKGWFTNITWVPSRPEGHQGYLELLNSKQSNQLHGIWYTQENGPEMLCRAVLSTALNSRGVYGFSASVSVS